MNLKCFDRILVHDLKVKSRSIRVTYTIEFNDLVKSYRLIESYTENIKVRGLEEISRLISIVPVINYGLFTDEIKIGFTLHEQDLKFLNDMMEVSAREILVNKIMGKTGLIRKEYIPSEEEITPEAAKPRAHVSIPETFTGTDIEVELDYGKSGVMVSGGKDSLLTFNILREVGFKTYPFFLNEAGRHWLVSLTAYRYFKENIPETRKVWSNIDRLFAFIEKNMKIVIPNYMKKSKENYPIRVFWFEHYVFSFLPLIIKYKVGNVNLGDEFDDVSEVTFEYRGIKHYYGVYDQSQEFDKYMTKWFRERGIGVRQWSPIRPISGLIVERILYKRYPEMIKLQTSCHSPIIENGIIRPCGKCSKCTGIILFLLANGIDPSLLRYKKETYLDLDKRIIEFHYRLNESELEHAVYLANKIWSLKLPRGKPHWHIETIHFDPIGSHVDSIPYYNIRKKIFSILEEYTKGYSILKNGKWVPTTREEILKLGECNEI